MMVRAYLNLGSNMEREKNLRGGLADLRHHFAISAVSPVYESQAVGFDGDSFYNLCVAIDTELTPQQLNTILHQIEDDHGRDRKQPKFSGRTLDIDLILYGDAHIDEPGMRLPRTDILKYAFVLKPLVDIAALEVHPLLQKTYQTLWQNFDQASQPLKQVPVSLENNG